ncbi:C4-dicarboxylate ABC transporter [Pseudoponticoccus marisrubri]|uniref:C4-dicarboxylate transport sensor protein DctB n=2 Tax=Pseudoponticoccus marisrubri TaxID=1685382 RepID=A0A0W7WM86_9RHOB|nr:C4-dicarboxylate ABC transporter [Pseudoponticoccus marisrubri]
MLRWPIRRGVIVALYLCAVAGLGWGVWAYGFAQALVPLAARGQADLALASDRLVTGLQRYRSVAVLLADHPVLTALHGAAGDPAAADALLLESADKTGALTALYADRSGRVMAAATPARPRDLAGQPWFQRALDGALGVGHAVEPLFGRRAFYYATPSFDAAGQVQGVLVIYVDIYMVERDWRGSRPAVFFTDAQSEVFVTNRSELLFWRRVPGGVAGPGGQLRPVRIREVAGFELWEQELSPYVPGTALRLEQALPVIGMNGVALSDAAPAQRIAALQAAVVMALCIVFGSVLFLVTERRRALARANVQLEGRVRDRTRDLETANAALRREVAERQEAETALRRAQEELVQAGKLSALGQMSAGISHELNQPLMAIRQFADNGAALLDKGRVPAAASNLVRISEMAARAARIIKNLRAFARNENEPMGRVDLCAVLRTAVELTESRLRSEQVALVLDLPPGPVLVRGGEVRLGQVFVNLINNAVDAMAGRPDKRLDIRVAPAGAARVTVRDTGPGIADPEKVFEPFYTTKQVGGEGMGLGLSISYGLVQSFGGRIHGANVPGGGAEFTVELDPWQEEAAA